MKLQAALDTLTLDECLDLLRETHGAVDVAEVGTPFVIEEGMAPVKAIKAAFPQIEVLADAKIMDAGEFEADKCFEAGADIVTVLGFPMTKPSKAWSAPPESTADRSWWT